MLQLKKPNIFDGNQLFTYGTNGVLIFITETYKKKQIVSLQEDIPENGQTILDSVYKPLVI